jgi:hypothetical protein
MSICDRSSRFSFTGIIYSNFGIYTSFNGAILTWATVAANPRA